MTTNQTIDGVSRRVCHACVTCPRDAYCPVCDPTAHGELRALLDSPDVQWLAMEVNGKPWVIKEGPNADKWRALGYELLPVEPAAQPQGEPVAIDERALYDAWRESNLGYVRPFNKYEWSAWQARAKLAEQPAPVAVVLPERDVEADHPTDPNEYALGYNACLDEVKRLNK